MKPQLQCNLFLQSCYLSKEAVNVGERTGVDSERLEKARRRIEKAEMGAEEEFGKEKQEGNDRSFQKCFILLSVPRYRAGDFRSAIEHYSVALQHKAKDAKVLSNRATAYYKLHMWLQCIKVGKQSQFNYIWHPGL